MQICRPSSVVEHLHGKEGVTGSTPVGGSSLRPAFAGLRPAGHPASSGSSSKNRDYAVILPEISPDAAAKSRFCYAKSDEAEHNHL